MKKCTIILLLGVVVLCGCGRNANSIEYEKDYDISETILEESSVSTNLMDSDNYEFIPPSNDGELFAFFVESWKSGRFDLMYDFCTKEIKDMVNLEQFTNGLSCTNEVFGGILEVTNIKCIEENSIKKYTCDLLFENVKGNLEVIIANNTIMGYNYEMDFDKPFIKNLTDCITEEYFVINSDGYELNAVYTDSGKMDAPSVLLIPGSGRSDYNETVGLLVPFEELARKLAENGINSLRMEKRTERYADQFLLTDSLEEEYFGDFGRALEWLTEKNGKDHIYLLGHSLGSQIAIEMADRYAVSGLILFNGTPRHLADILSEQYAIVDQEKENMYLYIAQQARSSAEENAIGETYFGATDYYWAGYNSISPVETLNKIGIPTLIINSHLDSQIFDKDIYQWYEIFEKKDNVSILLIDEMNHFGYVGEITDNSDIYEALPFSSELVDSIVSFIVRREEK